VYTWKFWIEILRLDFLSHRKEKRRKEKVFFVLYFFWAKLRWKRKLYGIWPVEHWLKTATILSLLLLFLLLFFCYILTTDNNRDEEVLVCCRAFFSFIAFRLRCSFGTRDFLLDFILDIIFIVLVIIQHQTNFSRFLPFFFFHHINI
jgi:hypothetical protein